MSETEPRNNLAWRVSVLEREVDALKQGKPDVIAERVTTLTRALAEHKREVHEDVNDLRDDVRSVRRILLGFLSGSTIVVLGAVLAFVLGR